MQDQSPSTLQSQKSSNPTDPLIEASPTSLDELMSRTPDITDAEADQIIAYYREQREKFAKIEAAPKVKKAPKQKGPVLSLDDLDGDLL